ncbi:MAG: heavy metal translocating P-type ATPase [Prevotella sp.]|nr:heavy metal translocating P-type ATPase [Prevotella sp.]
MHEHEHHHEGEIHLWQLALSAFLLLAGIIFNALHIGWFQPNWVQLAWYAAAFLPVGINVIQEAVEEAAHGDIFSEFMLMSIAAIGAFCIGEYPEAVAVMLLYCIGEMLQEQAADKARDNIKSLIALRPDMARVQVTDNQGNTNWVEKSPEEVKTGDFIEIKAGERVPLDGILCSGDATFNTAALTGESIPRMITKGQEVLAGMIPDDSIVHLQVSRPASESAISRVLKMVEDAVERKAPTELFIHRFAKVYTPIVIGLAALVVILPWIWSLFNPSFTFHFSQWLHSALVLLVISCPCALVISVPLTYFGGIGAASRRGILFKGGNGLDAINTIDTVVFDKTGTLTTGQFAVTHIEGLDQDALHKVVTIESTSNHPIAKAIISETYRRGESAYPPAKNPSIQHSTSIQGYGISAEIDKENWLIGTLRLMEREKIDYPKQLCEIPETIVACAKNGKYLGYILLSDTPKDEAQVAITRLKEMGLHTEILSGDKHALVEKVARQLQVDEAHGDLLPQGKVEHIQRLKGQGRKVAFVGDGINDAPVLALSDVGLAMGALGADMAIETADVVIQTDQPTKVAEAIDISKRTRRIVKQNISLAIGIKVLVMILGILGIANLWEAVFADTGVALLAVLNSLRILSR